jgi:DNA polymerase-3 subunit delta
VEQVLSHNREESPFTLFDAMIEPGKSRSQRLEGAALVLHQIRSRKDGNAVGLIAGLAWCFRRLQDWHQLQRQGNTDSFALKTNGFGSPRAQSQFRAAARIWNQAQAGAALALLAETDAELRSGLQALEAVILDNLIYHLVY